MPLQARPPVPGASPIRITRPTVFRGRAVEVGEEFFDATGPEASVMIGCGKAVRITASAPDSPPARNVASAPAETAALEPRAEIAELKNARQPRTRERKTS